MTSPHFLLVGNGPYLNRGCEAIVRGTTHILDASFGNQATYSTASFGTEAQIAAQAAQETFSRLQHAWLRPKGRISVDYLKYQMTRFLGLKTDFCINGLPPQVSQCLAALQVGGDNYTIDYGYPRSFMDIDRWLERHGVPLVLWGASVGPFDKDPAFEREMTAHLSRFTLITARESRSYRYLRDLGLKNILHVADPAFLMEPQPITGLDLPPTFLGLNFSPLNAKYMTGMNLDEWCKVCASAVAKLLSQCDLPVILIPHVMSAHAGNNDFIFLQAVARIVNNSARVTVLGDGYTAAQLKWVIGKAIAFAGARTHSTIAAFSMGVPTLSLAYSTKAWGINEDLFGHTEYCMDANKLQREDVLAKRMLGLLQKKDSIQRELQLQLPIIQTNAMKAGVALRACLKPSNSAS